MFYIYVAFILITFVMGIVNTLPETEKTFKVQAYISGLAIILGLALIVLSIIKPSFTLAIFAVVTYFIVPGVGQTITLLLTRRAYAISPFAWIMTILFFLTVIYVVSFSRIISVT